MTRINVVPVEELTNKHLMAEYHEITRIFRLVREAQNRGINKYNIDYRLSIVNSDRIYVRKGTCFIFL